MHSNLLLFHSAIRYFVLIFLILVVVRSLMGVSKKAPYTSLDDKLGVWLLMLTHTQLILGFVLYFVSPAVIFGSETMKDPAIRYWTVEHVTMMVIAVALITVARVTSKRMADATAKHKRMFLLNGIALLVILAAIATSGRGFFTLTGA